MVHYSHIRVSDFRYNDFHCHKNRKLKLFRGHLFPNAVKVMLLISDAKYYILVKLCRTAESIHLFNITGKLTLEHVTFKRNMIWDILEIDWKEVSMTLNEKRLIYQIQLL